MFLQDMADNAIEPILQSSALQVVNYTSDSTNPYTMSFSLDMNRGILNITFSETVNASSLRIKDITIQSDYNGGLYWNLTNSTVSLINDIKLAVYISIYDLNQLKFITGLAGSVNTTYMSMLAGAVNDMNGNPLIPILKSSAIKVTTFVPDTTNLSLVRFDFDLNLGQIILAFSEPPNIATINATYLTLLNNGTAIYQQYSIIYPIYNSTYRNGLTIAFMLNTLDLNAIKLLNQLSTSRDNLFLSIHPLFASDTFGNVVNQVTLAVPIQVSKFIQDTTCPEITSFSLNLDLSILYLTFDEPVNANSFVSSGLTLQNMLTSSSAYYTLINAYTTNSNSTTLRIHLPSSELDQIKINFNLATSIANTFLNVSYITISDMASNQICPSVLQGNHTPDSTRPMLSSFDLDMNQFLLILTFSEPILLSTFQVSLITLQQNRIDSGQYYTLTSAAISGGSEDLLNPRVIELNIFQNDIDKIKNLTSLATSASSTYLSLANATVLDTNFRPVEEVPANMSINVTNYTQDTTQPKIISFDLNMNTSTLLLSFSEAINSSSFNASAIILQSASNNPQTFYQLSGIESVKLITLTTIETIITVGDLNVIKKLRNLAIDASSTYLSTAGIVIQDFVLLGQIQINKSEAIIARSFSPDVTKPRLQRISLNLTNEVLTLWFDEIIDASTIIPNRIALKNSATPHHSSYYTLSSSTPVFPVIDDTVIYIALVKQDLDAIKLDVTLATMANNTCIELIASAVSDTALVPNGISINCICADPLSLDFYPDRIRPNLNSFYFDLDDGELILNFDEPVLAHTFNITQISFLSSSSINNTGTAIYQLLGGTHSLSNSLQIVANSTVYDINNIKQLTSLLRENQTTYLAHTMKLVRDMNLNYIYPILNTNALASSLFIDDSSRPKLVYWELNLTSNIMLLHFDEIVDPSTLNVSQITLQTTSGIPTPGSSYTLTLSSVGITSSESKDIAIQLSNEDTNALKANKIALTLTTAYITMTSTTIYDVVGFPVIERLFGLRSLFVYSDFIRPQLNSFTLNLTSHQIMLSFSETIAVSTLKPNIIILTNGSSDSTEYHSYYKLTSSILITTLDSNTVIIEISTFDLNEIKKRLQLATSRSNSFISVNESFVSDVFGNFLLQITNLQASDYFEDKILVVFEGFDLDMNIGEMKLTFSETVNSKTLNTKAITIQSDFVNSAQSYTLSEFFTYVTDNAPIITFALIREDLNNLKFFQSLAISSNTTYLSITQSLILDLNGNNVIPIVLKVSLFTDDTTPPILYNFTIDMNSGMMVLYFDETVLDSSVIISYWVLRNNDSVVIMSAAQHQLTHATSTRGINDPIIYVYFSPDDLNEIKRKDLCTKDLGVYDCYLAYRVFAITDMMNNQIEGCQELAFSISLQTIP